MNHCFPLTFIKLICYFSFIWFVYFVKHIFKGQATIFGVLVSPEPGAQLIFLAMPELFFSVFRVELREEHSRQPYLPQTLKCVYLLDIVIFQEKKGGSRGVLIQPSELTVEKDVATIAGWGGHSVPERPCSLWSVRVVKVLVEVSTVHP